VSVRYNTNVAESLTPSHVNASLDWVTNYSTAQQLANVRAAIAKVLIDQEHDLNGTKVTRADLDKLRKLEKDLNYRYQMESNNGDTSALARFGEQC
jgi:hypothetical protein